MDTDSPYLLLFDHKIHFIREVFQMITSWTVNAKKQLAGSHTSQPRQSNATAYVPKKIVACTYGKVTYLKTPDTSWQVIKNAFVAITSSLD